jgi:hypothetical protein
MDTPGLLSRNGFGQDNRKRNIVLFRYIFCGKCKWDLDVMRVRLTADAYNTVRVTDPSWIPEIKEPFSDPFGDPYNLSDYKIPGRWASTVSGTCRVRVSTQIRFELRLRLLKS